MISPTVKCRGCGELKSRGDICPVADCTGRKSTQVQRKSSKWQFPITTMVKHGFHAEYLVRGIA